MKRSVSLALVALLAAVTLVGQTGHGRGPGAGFGGLSARKGGLSAACIEALALSDSQKASLEALRQEFASDVQTLFEQRRSLHDQIEAALEAANPDPTAIGRLVIADHGVAGQIRAAHDQFETRFKALLNSEQLTNYAALSENGVCARPAKGPR
jgi:hypothetical protein